MTSSKLPDSGPDASNVKIMTWNDSIQPLLIFVRMSPLCAGQKLHIHVVLLEYVQIMQKISSNHVASKAVSGGVKGRVNESMHPIAVFFQAYCIGSREVFFQSSYTL